MMNAAIWKALGVAASACLMMMACKTGARSTEVQAPPRPSGVPENALWAGGLDGGAFILLTPTSSASRYIGKVYDDNTGQVVFSGTLALDAKKSAPIDVADARAFDAWDGDTLYLTDGRTLNPEGK
jgi:hypothetical protein